MGAGQHATSPSTWLPPYFDAYGCDRRSAWWGRLGSAVDTSDPRHRSKGRRVVQLLLGPLVLAGLGVGLLADRSGSGRPLGARAAICPAPNAAVTGSAFAGSVPGHLQPFQYALPFGQVALLLAGVELLAMGVLAILPIPPLDGGRLLFALDPRSGAVATGPIPARRRELGAC